MRARVVVLNQDKAFLSGISPALTGAGYRVSVFTAPMIALNAMESFVSVDLLLVGGDFGARQPDGISVARMARHRFGLIKILFAVSGDFAGPASELGTVVPATIGAVDLLATVNELLLPTREPELRQ